jgi:hypothetical protein
MTTPTEMALEFINKMLSAETEHLGFLIAEEQPEPFVQAQRDHVSCLEIIKTALTKDQVDVGSIPSAALEAPEIEGLEYAVSNCIWGNGIDEKQWRLILQGASAYLKLTKGE